MGASNSKKNDKDADGADDGTIKLSPEQADKLKNELMAKEDSKDDAENNLNGDIENELNMQGDQAMDATGIVQPQSDN